MSRFNQWNNTLNKLIWKVQENEEPDWNKAIKIVRSRINIYCNHNDFKGSRTDKIMFVKKNIADFHNKLMNNKN